MLGSQIFKDDVRYLLFSEIYHKLEEPKAKRKAYAIVNATIDCLAKKGFEGVTLEMVARESAVTRQNIKYYFKDIDDLLLTAIKFIRLFFQKFVIDQMVHEPNEVKMLERYVLACFDWTDMYKNQSQVWLAFLHRCTRSKGDRRLNTEAVSTGTQRIAALLESGKQKGLFQYNDSAVTAKGIQTLITGAMITYKSEDHSDPKKFVSTILGRCLNLAGVQTAP